MSSRKSYYQESATEFVPHKTARNIQLKLAKLSNANAKDEKGEEETKVNVPSFKINWIKDFTRPSVLDTVMHYCSSHSSASIAARRKKVQQSTQNTVEAG